MGLLRERSGGGSLFETLLEGLSLSHLYHIVTAHPLKSICFVSERGCLDRLAWVTTTTRSDFTRVVMSKRYVMGGFLGDFALWDGRGDP